MGEGIVALIGFLVLLGVLVGFALTRRRGRASALDSWRSAPPGDLSKREPSVPAEMFDPDRGHGGITGPHHGDQRTFGGYGSDTEQRPDDGRSSRDTAA
jgi:hypothetical protein